MAQDPRRLFDAKDIEAAALFANLVSGGAEDFYPLKVDANGYLLISMTVGSVSLSSTASTITNAVGNPVNVSLASTVVTIESSGGLNVTLASTEVTVKSAVAGFNVNVATATLGTVTVTGTVTPSTTASTIANAVGNPVNVALTSTEVTVKSAVAGFNVNIATATLGTVTITGTVTPSTTASTITNAVANPVNTSLTNTAVSVSNSAGIFNVNIRTATLGTVVTSFSSTLVTAHLSPSQTRVSVTLITGQNGVSAGVGASDTGTQRIVLANDMGRTLTGATGTISATWTSIFTPSNKCKVYAFSFTTTSSSEVTVVIADGLFANAKEKWRATLMAPAGSSAGANLAVQPPGYLFSSRSTSAITISLSTAVLVHYSLSFFDEA